MNAKNPIEPQSSKSPKDLSSYRHPALDFLVTFFQSRLERARSTESDRGASAVEWVIISAVVVAIVGVVAAIINGALSSGAESVSDCIEGADAGSTC